MYLESALAKTHQTLPPSTAADDVTTCLLTDVDKAEVLDFLNVRPLHNVMLIGFILDNGLASPLNRGTFYGCRNRKGELEGVALIGHVTLMETHTERTMLRFADLASKCTSTHLVMGDRQTVGDFWNYYSDGAHASGVLLQAGGLRTEKEVRRACREHLLALRFPVQVKPTVVGLRLATPEDLDLILPVHAQLAFEESGVNPLETDPEGFRARCLRRVEMKRTWVWIESGTLIFKAEVISDTPHVVYLEGVWTNPNYRSKGYGSRCLSQLMRDLLSTRPRASVCVFVNEKNPAALRFYERVGFKSI